MTSAAAPTSAKPVPIWDDFVDIFVAPKEVFARRANGSVAIPLLVLVVVITVLAVGTQSLLRPGLDGDIARQLARVAQTNPQLGAAQREQMQASAAKFAGVGFIFAGVMMAIRVLILAFVLWIVSKLFDSAMSFNSAMIVTTYASFPLILAMVASALIAYFLDPVSFTSLSMATPSLAHFLDPDTTNAKLIGLASRVDLFVVWVTVLMGVGTYVVGKISKANAAAVALIVWLLGAVPVLLRRG